MRPPAPPAIVRSCAAAFAAMFFGALLVARASATTISLTPVVQQTVTTLLFHQVSEDPVRSAHGEDNVKHPWLSPAQFDDLLTLLERRGYTVVSLADALDALGVHPRAGRPAPLPAKPLLLTFDDGYVSALASATPILRKHRATATMFFEGKVTGTNPGRLTLADLREMRGSGVWSLASHGWAGHSPLVVAADGTLSPYWYANLMWRAADNRLETLVEYEARVRDDLHRFRTTFEPLLGATLDVFAYPSGEFGQNGPLASDGNALTRLEAGHSNSRDFKPIFARVLASEGFRAAFAVAVPGAVHAASRQDGPYSFPRIGIGAEFEPKLLDTIASDGIELPEITANDTFADCMALATENGALLTASVRRPELFRLTSDGRVQSDLTVSGLLADRSGEPALISALVERGDDVTVLQQAGWWEGATAYLTRLHIDAAHATVTAREALPPSLRWSVGAITLHDRLVAMTDEGRFYDVERAKDGPLFTTALGTADDRHARFAGPVISRGRILIYDRMLAVLEEIDERGNVLGKTALAGDIRALAASGDELFVVDWNAKRRVVRRFRVANG